MIRLLTFILASWIGSSAASSLAAPPQTALIVAFESVYDLSLLANTLSDQGIDSTLILPSTSHDYYEHLIEVEILRVNVTIDNVPEHRVSRSLEACQSLLTDEKLLQRVQQIQPTFVIFPSRRHDGCLLPWTKFINSIPVIWAQDPDEEFYTFHRAGVALPVHSSGFWSGLYNSFSSKSVASSIETNYALPALRLAEKYLKDFEGNLQSFYSDVDLVLWNMDPILRSDYAYLTPLLVDIGCCHCRGVQPLPAELQKSLVEHRLGVIVVMLDKVYSTIVQELAQKLPQGRDGQAVVWKTRNVQIQDLASTPNLFIDTNVDRQDLIGYGRTRLLLSHCSDTELLEAAFHGTPVICVPRDLHEERNADRAAEWKFSMTLDSRFTSDELVELVGVLHETTDYRESARKVSMGIRDRPSPASDRLTFWLSYVARNNYEGMRFLSAKRNVRGLTEEARFFEGAVTGFVLGVIVAICSFVVRFILMLNAENTQRKLKAEYSR